MKTLRGNQLNASDKQHVLAAFVYRGTIENNQRNPQAVRQTGSKLPLITDARWLEITDFDVTKAGRLDKRVHHCTTHNHEVPEHKAMIDAWASKRVHELEPA